MIRLEHIVKHATNAALKGLSELLDQIRIRSRLQEKRPGIFYKDSKSLLHFHEDPAGLFADLRTGDNFDRYPVNNRSEWQRLLAAIDLITDVTTHTIKGSKRGTKLQANASRGRTAETKKNYSQR
jgi:hypothetical protein